jgi:hypothetical protein
LIGSPHNSIHTAFKTLRKAEHRTLVFAIYFFDKHTLQSAMRYFAMDLLPFIRTNIQIRWLTW